MRNFVTALALAACLSAPGLALAHGNNNGMGSFETFGAMGSFATQGGATAFSYGPGSVESYGGGAAGIEITRCNTCGGFAATGMQDNQAGVMSWGNGAGYGASNGAAQGHVFGFTGRLNRGR